MDNKDTIFLALLTAGVVVLLALASRPRSDLHIAPVAAADDTNTVGMSLEADRDPPEVPAFNGRFIFPPPLATMMPSIGDQ